MGRVLLAWAGPERITRFLENIEPVARTAATVTDPAELRSTLAQVRERGWAIVDGELEEGLVSVAAPVRDRRDAVVAALASSTSAGRLAPDRLVRQTVPVLLDTAAAISADLGHQASEPPAAGGGPY
jgi:IclR family pca regulon transcriptional regulator